MIQNLYQALDQLRKLVDMRYKVLSVAEKLKQVHSCSAAVIEGQDCRATVEARWAARELTRICKEVDG
jgi:hypothetical protein